MHLTLTEQVHTLTPKQDLSRNQRSVSNKIHSTEAGLIKKSRANNMSKKFGNYEYGENSVEKEHIYYAQLEEATPIISS